MHWHSSYCAHITILDSISINYWHFYITSSTRRTKCFNCDNVLAHGCVRPYAGRPLSLVSFGFCDWRRAQVAWTSWGADWLLRSSRGKGVGSVETDRAGKTCVETEKGKKGVWYFWTGLWERLMVEKGDRGICVLWGNHRTGKTQESHIPGRDKNMGRYLFGWFWWWSCASPWPSPRDE